MADQGSAQGRDYGDDKPTLRRRHLVLGPRVGRPLRPVNSHPVNRSGKKTKKETKKLQELPRDSILSTL